MRVQGMDATAGMKVGNEPQFFGNRAADAVQVKTGQERVAQQKKIETAEYPINERVVSEAVDKMNKVVEGYNRRFEYKIHEGTNDIMIRVIDETTKEVIREIPPKKILDMIASMLEMAGLMVDERR
ncbi:MAG TPA: flagellar protein FlaG [Clostridiales bacterium]|nr:flagellar protein FlaG [Clostridiales bacterium]HOL92063.1 flagellar protein FlaG [Clostridiales bacterium]HPP35023.1 flagellar protein FlaG [Clostridiales bacterium]